MTDYSELKKLAEAAMPGPWVETGSGGDVYVAQDRLGLLLEVAKCGVGLNDQAWLNAKFIAAANPTAVVALIAQNEGLHAQHARDSGELRKLCAARDSARREREQLKTAISTPESVFINMKAHKIARPTLRSMVDLYGDVVNGDEAQLLEIANLRAEVEALRKVAACGKMKVVYGFGDYGLCGERSRYPCDSGKIMICLDCQGLRDDVEQNQYGANAWRNSEESVWIEVFNSEGDDPFISAISGQITVEQLALIQAEILEYPEDYFEKGPGLYVFKCRHYQAHYDNVGMTEPAHWETDFESYSPFPWEEEGAAMSKGEQP